MAGVPDWLKETRLRQRHPETGKPWSQEYLVERVNEWAGSDWTLYRSNYVNYESGKQRPESETLRRFVAFWEAHNEPGPDLTPTTTIEPVDPQLALARAIERQAAAIERQNALLAGPASDDTPDAGPVSLIESLVEEQRLTRLMLEAVLLRLGGLSPDPEAELRRTWVEERMAEESSRTQLPTPGRLETPAGSR